MVARWTNWVGNQSFECERYIACADEEAVAKAVRQGGKLRTHGTGHSDTPIVETPGTLLDMSALRGIISVDHSRRLVTAWAQTPIGDFGDALWEHGLALANQGDIDTQVIAGAIATGTHGSGRTLKSISSWLQSARLVDGAGELREVSAELDVDVLHALQVSIGLLGIMTRVTLEVTGAYYLHEQIKVMHVDEVLERWDDLLAGYRHFSYFWMPTDGSAELYGFPPAPADHCMVKLYRAVAPDEVRPGPGERVDRSYRIYPHVFEPNFHELEYYVEAGRGREAFAAMRDFMKRSLPDSRFPLEARFVKADEGWMSPFYKRDSMVLSISGTPGTDYWPYLRAADELLSGFDARPHWGKLHFMTAERLAKLFPRYGDFKAMRRRFDPGGTFLNPHLEALFN
jgi:FAD/FMN-containing dehydrogenase